MKNLHFLVFLVLFVLLWDAVIAQSTLPKPGDRTGSAKWVRVSANLVTTSAEDVLAIVDDARAQGANGLLFHDTKSYTYWFRSPGQIWIDRMNALRNGVRNRGMNFIISVSAIGYCDGPTGFNTNLAAGYPLRDVSMRVTGSNRLVPVETASIANGGFEDARGNVPAGWVFQDAAGRRTFIDSTVSHSGSRSFRFDVKPGQRSGLSGTFTVKKFQQYTLTLWVRTQRLTARNILVLIRDNDGRDDSGNENRFLGSQYLSFPDGRGRGYFNSATDLTMEWTEMKLAFNSLEATTISLFLGAWDGAGRVWWDDIRVNSTPMLNLLRRSSLPFSIKTEAGRILNENTHYTRARDPMVGRSRGYRGDYDTYHTVPLIRVRPSAGLSAGDIVKLEGYHTVVALSGQVGCTWSDNQIFNLARRTFTNIERDFNPDGYFLGHDEIRTGGWEPAEIERGTSGQALAAYIRRELRIIRSATGGNRHIYLWSDMFDPTRNAVANFYHVRGTLAGSWNGIGTNKAVIMNWEDTELVESGKDSVAFFDRRGYTQIIASFYDYDVQENYDDWQNAIDGRPTAGSMYTTFAEDFSKLREYGNLWW